MTGTNVFGCTLRARMAQLARTLKDTYDVDLPDMDGPHAEPVSARIDTGRWIVDCPDCRSAEYLWPDEPVFFCTNCFNASVGGRWRLVEVPGERGAIEHILLARPFPWNRHWRPGETTDDLRAENVAHGQSQEVS